jgi:hypothetical protein
MTILESIQALIEFTFDNPLNILKRIDLCKVDEQLAQKIRKISGLETIDYVISLDNYAVLHILNNHSATNEDDMKLVGVEKQDFNKLVSIIFDADKIEYKGKSWRTGKDLLLFTKVVENMYEVVLEVRTVTKRGKQNRLAITTYYIKKKKK